MTALSPGFRKFLALAILAGLLLLIWVAAAQPILDTKAANDRAIDQSTALLSKFERIASTRPALERQLKGVRVRKNSVGRFLEGDSAELAAAGLQRTIKQLVTRHGGRLKSTRVLPVKEENEFQRVSITVNMSADTASLLRILYELETANPYLFVDRIFVRSRTRAGTGGVPGTRKANTSNDNRDMQVRYDVHGYLWDRES